MKKLFILATLASTTLFGREAIWYGDGPDNIWQNMENWWTSPGKTAHPDSISGTGDDTAGNCVVTTKAPANLVLNGNAEVSQLRFEYDTSIDLNDYTFTHEAYGRSNRNLFLIIQSTYHAKLSMFDGDIVTKDTKGTIVDYYTNLNKGAAILEVGNGTDKTTFTTYGSSQVYGGTKGSHQAGFIVQANASYSTVKTSNKGDILLGTNAGNANIQADIYGSVKADGAFTLKNDATLYVHDGGSVEAAGQISLDGYTSVDGSITGTSGNIVFNASADINGSVTSANAIHFLATDTNAYTSISGAVTAGKGIEVTSAGSVFIDSTAVLKSGNGNYIRIASDATINGTLNSANVITIYDADVTINESAQLTAMSLVIYRGAEVTINKKINVNGLFMYGDDSKIILNVVDAKYNDTVRTLQFRTDSNTKTNNYNIVEVRKSNAFKGINFTTTSQQVEFILNGTAESGRALLEFDKLFSGEDSKSSIKPISDLGGTNLIYFTNFENDTVWFGEKFDEEKYIGFFRFDGEEVSADMIDWKEATIRGTNGYYLNLVSVPEPAEYAVLLGALAIAFAVYRRRK
ncbi:MAG: hypothetical protein J6B07_01070 [Opitutales bacterium]|nr:hypothetical protein [Opitutales bacterium]